MSPTPGRVLRMSYLAASVAGVAFFVMSVAWLGVWPARALAEQARLTGPEHALALTASEVRGRAIYAREGCAYCHSQQIRFTDADVTRFGAPTLAWESRNDTPQLMGTRRIGPDLSRASGTRSADWHFAHLYSPRSVVPASVMPAYRSLFAGGPEAPAQGALDLVAYIETLGRARELLGTDALAVSAPHAHTDGLAPVTVLNANPARTRRTGDVPAIPAGGDWDQGKSLYAAKCAVCHGATRQGDGPGTEALRPRATNLAAHNYAQERLVQVLWNGVAGTAMPAWRDLPLAELAALVRYLSDPRPPGPLREDSMRPDAEMLAQGKQVYDANCTQCHGTDGAGDGPAARLLPIAPTNFRAQRLWGNEAIRILGAGIDGTPMAAWGTRLSAGEIVAVSEYIVQLYRDGLAERDRAGRR